MLDDWFTRAECAVYSRLRRLAYVKDNVDVVYPSEQQLAQDCRLTERTVRNCIEVLEKKWLIEVNRRWYKRRNNYYVLSYEKYECKMLPMI